MFLLIFLLAGAGCDQGQPDLVIESPEAFLSPLLLGSGAVFMTIVNTGKGNDALVAARTDIPGSIAELHDVRDGNMKKIGRVALSGESSVRLRPGSVHIMIFQMPRRITTGDPITLILSFERSGEKRVPLRFSKNAVASAVPRHK